MPFYRIECLTEDNQVATYHAFTADDDEAALLRAYEHCGDYRVVVSRDGKTLKQFERGEMPSRAA
ncbi:MAG TPA: hypothetical protein VHU23_03975 [Rhizomicrobium sp.]|nr:hypothetical protein [Rhizomicrobium sp.]